MIKIAIADNSELYLKRLHDYWSRAYGSSAMMIYIYKDIGHLLEEMQTQRFDIVLVSSQMEMDWEGLPGRVLKLILLPGRTDGEMDGIPALAKNGNADELYHKIMELYDNHMNISRQALPGQMVFFTSGTGGCGTTSAAIAYGKHLAGMGRKVLYISLEEAGGIEEAMTGGGEKNMEDLFYLCKTGRKNVSYSMESIVSADESGLQYILPCKNPLELMEKDAGEIGNMLATVTEKGAFDVVITDRRLALDQVGMELLKMADRVVLVARTGYMERSKQRQTLAFLEEVNARSFPCMQKLRILYNKSAQVQDSRPEVIGALPMVAEKNPRAVTGVLKDYDLYEAILTENQRREP